MPFATDPGVRWNRQRPLLILGGEGRWQRFREEKEQSDVLTTSDPMWSKDIKGGFKKASVTKEKPEDKDSSEPTVTLSNPTCEIPKYWKAPIRIKSTTASPRILGRRKADNSGNFLLKTI